MPQFDSTAPSEPVLRDFEDTMQVALSRIVATQVLIVDDDPIICETLVELVKAEGFEARAVDSGKAAIAAMRADFAPIVIVDRKMAGMDGLAVCEAIRAEHFPSYVYLILLTGQDSEEDILSGLAAGADDYLSKRASSAHLVARLRTAQRILSLEQSLRMMLQEKKQLASTDALTGAYNRRHFNRHFPNEIKRAQRASGTLALLLLDIDHFKRVNDTYGHAAGDEVLRQFAARVSAALPRETDWFVRLGGEEFAVVLPQTDEAGAVNVAEKLRECICASPFSISSRPLAVTVSIGVSCAECSQPNQPVSLDALMDRADRALYASKESGRNRVMTCR